MNVTLVPGCLALALSLAAPLAFGADGAPTNRYKLLPQAGTTIRCGNATPAFGQAGGGVEILFAAGCAAGTAQLPPTAIPER